jgi:hypothetical protein
MASKVSLTVNEIPIQLDYFVREYLLQVVSGIIASLKDTGKIGTLDLTIDKGQVEIKLNGEDVPLIAFPMKIIKSTMDGLVAPLKGVSSAVNTLQVNIVS